MPEIIKNIAQNTPEWIDLRLGSVGSTAIDLIAPGKAGYKNTLYKLAGERITGTPSASVKFPHADRGHEFEQSARSMYEFINGVKVEQIALIKGDKPYTHTSTDGLVGENGILEIKVRIPSIWIELFEGGLEPIADRRQRDWDLYISKREWVDSVNYCPEIARAGHGGYLEKRIYRDEEKIKELKDISDKFLRDLDALTSRLRH